MKLVGITGGVLAGVVCAVLADDVFKGAIDSEQYLAPQSEYTASHQTRGPLAEGQLGLAGQWVSNCYWFEPGVYQVRIFDFVLSQLVTVTTLSYADSNCQQKPGNYTEISATWDLGERLTSEEGLDVYALDVLLKVGNQQELTTVKQIVSFQQDQLLMGINSSFDEYPQKLDWEIQYTKIR